MNVIIRADASLKIGTGHIMRCMTLADALREKGALVSFICSELPGNLCDYVENNGYKVYRLPNLEIASNNVKQHTKYSQWLGVSWDTDVEQIKAIFNKEKKIVDWLIVDHYAIDEKWETNIRSCVRKIMVIDDLSDRAHDCDILLDQNLYGDMENPYECLVPKQCSILLGPKYALLRQEFKDARKNLREFNGNIKRILIFFGGSDPTNETAKALEAINMLNRKDISFDVVVGSANPYKEQIKQISSKILNITFYCQVNNIAELMVKADLSLGASGSTTWERCCLRLPSIVVAVAHNQEAIAEECHRRGIVLYLGVSKDITANRLKIEIEKLLNNHNNMLNMSRKGANLVDGKGAKRVVDVMLEWR